MGNETSSMEACMKERGECTCVPCLKAMLHDQRLLHALDPGLRRLAMIKGWSLVPEHLKHTVPVTESDVCAFWIENECKAIFGNQLQLQDQNQDNIYPPRNHRQHQHQHQDDYQPLVQHKNQGLGMRRLGAHRLASMRLHDLPLHLDGWQPLSSPSSPRHAPFTHQYQYQTQAQHENQGLGMRRLGAKQLASTTLHDLSSQFDGWQPLTPSASPVHAPLTHENRYRPQAQQENQGLGMRRLGARRLANMRLLDLPPRSPGWGPLASSPKSVLTPISSGQGSIRPSLSPRRNRLPHSHRAFPPKEVDNLTNLASIQNCHNGKVPRSLPNAATSPYYRGLTSFDDMMELVKKRGEARGPLNRAAINEALHEVFNGMLEREQANFENLTI